MRYVYRVISRSQLYKMRSLGQTSNQVEFYYKLEDAIENSNKSIKDSMVVIAVPYLTLKPERVFTHEGEDYVSSKSLIYTIAVPIIDISLLDIRNNVLIRIKDVKKVTKAFDLKQAFQQKD